MGSECGSECGMGRDLHCVGVSGGTASCQEAERWVTSHLVIVLISVFVGADDKATVSIPVPPWRRGLVAVRGIYRQGAGDIGHMSARPCMHHAMP